ncbi:hypothetical protein ACHAWF_000699 [Thalassiosira exigua]
MAQARRIDRLRDTTERQALDQLDRRGGGNPNDPSHGVLVAPGVNAKIHQHMFCARLNMAVDRTKNTVSKVDVVPGESPYGNAFGPAETVLENKRNAMRVCEAIKARMWKISNAEGKGQSDHGQCRGVQADPVRRKGSNPANAPHEPEEFHQGEFRRLGQVRAKVDSSDLLADR